MEKLSTSVSQTRKIGKKLAANLSGGEIILLSGPLGAGKTILAKGIAQGLKIDKDDVNSPTFVLLKVHKGKLFLQHFDLYRLRDPQDIFALGYEEYFYPAEYIGRQGYGDAVTIIEWPERLKFLLPKEFLKVKLVLKNQNKRLLKFSAKGKTYRKILENMKKDKK